MPESTKVCPTCKEEKPLSEFIHQLKPNGSRRPGYCKPCHSRRTIEWKKKNPAKYRAQANRWQRRRNARAALYREMIEGKRVASPEALDAARRALVEAQAAVTGEAEMVAYFRGFTAGAQRTQRESERFESLKDLIDRIAAEQARKIRALPYEDALSYAYEAALAYVRKKTPDDQVHFRSKAAMAIRNGIIDGVRVTPSALTLSSKRAIRRGEATQWGRQLGEEAEALRANEEQPKELAWDALLSVKKLRPRERTMLEMLAKGHTFLEVGEALGVTESRACQLARGIRERCGDELLAALSA